MAKSIIFLKEDLFYATLRKRVNSYFIERNTSKYANKKWFIKASILIVIYILNYALLILYGHHYAILIMCYVVIGMLSIFIGLNIGHDAAHHSISKQKTINSIFLMVFDFLGANSYMWKLRHIHAHHPYPNIIGFDSDIQQSKIVRIFPTDKFRLFHRFQHYYMPVVLIFLYTLNWFIFRDFIDYTKKIFGMKKITHHPIREWIKLILFKAVFLSIIIIIPSLLSSSITHILVGFIVMNISSGIVISIALVSTHVGDYHEFPTPSDNNSLDTTWSKHQMLTTSDFCTNNTIITSLFGGFNHHVFHHLFPRINHIHYASLTPILIDTAKEFDMPYHVDQSILQVFKSHLSLLKREGFEFWKHNQEI